MSVDHARVAEAESIRTLLLSCGLPTEDLDAGVQAHWVWRDAGRVVGTIGLDLVGAVAVIRSLATDAAFRGAGIATALCEAAEDEARRRGVAAVYLLTESAAGFAERRGYRVIERASVPDSVAQHRQFASGCCQCARTMVKSFI